MDTRYVESSLLESMNEDKKKVIERTHEVLSNADIREVSVLSDGKLEFHEPKKKEEINAHPDRTSFNFTAPGIPELNQNCYPMVGDFVQLLKNEGLTHKQWTGFIFHAGKLGLDSGFGSFLAKINETREKSGKFGMPLFTPDEKGIAAFHKSILDTHEQWLKKCPGISLHCMVLDELLAKLLRDNDHSIKPDEYRYFQFHASALGFDSLVPWVKQAGDHYALDRAKDEPKKKEEIKKMEDFTRVLQESFKKWKESCPGMFRTGMSKLMDMQHAWSKAPYIHS